MAWIFRTVGIRPNLTKHFITQTARASVLSIPNKAEKKKKRKQNPNSNPIQNFSSLLPHLENILLRDAHFKFLIKIKEFLSSQPEHSLPLSAAGRLHRQLGFPRGRDVTRYLQQHPLLFTTRCNPDGRLWFALSDLMETLIQEEHSIMVEMEVDRITKLRKLIMMSSRKRIPLKKIKKCRLLFGIPRDFAERVLHYPNFFRIKVEEDGTNYLELVEWDPRLAVTKLEKEFMEDEDEAKKTFNFPFENRKGLGLGLAGERKLSLLNTFPLVSPYSEGWKLKPVTEEAEKYRAGLVHEFLSLTLEKRASIHEIVEFREEFNLSGDLYQTLHKQAQTFYLGGTELNWAVFLRKAYGGDGSLKFKDSQVVFNEKLKMYGEMQENTFKSLMK